MVLDEADIIALVTAVIALFTLVLAVPAAVVAYRKLYKRSISNQKPCDDLEGRIEPQATSALNPDLSTNRGETTRPAARAPLAAVGVNGQPEIVANHGAERAFVTSQPEDLSVAPPSDLCWGGRSQEVDCS